jgi:hypothetical protein
MTIETFKFHYLVRVKYVKHIKANGEIVYHTSQKEFFQEAGDESPIKVRNRAFAYYHNYLANILEQDGVDISKYTESESTLDKFLREKYQGKLLYFGPKWGDLSPVNFIKQFGIAIGVYWVEQEESEKEKTLNAKMVKNIPTLSMMDLWLESYLRESLIHGIKPGGVDLDDMSVALESELDAYEEYKYSYPKEQILEMRYWGTDAGEAEDYRLLRTPFDWTGYDRPDWWKDSPQLRLRQHEAERNKEEAERNKALIEGGENEQTEFKTVLYYNWEDHTSNGWKTVSYRIARAIASLANTRGGQVFIGVDDAGTVVGLDKDFSLAKGTKHGEEDYFQQRYSAMIKYFLGLENVPGISCRFFEDEGKKYARIHVRASEQPIFIWNVECTRREFFIRSGSTTRPLLNDDTDNSATIDIEKVLRYWTSRNQNAEEQ